MAKKIWILGDNEFHSKAAVKRHGKLIAESYPDGSIVSDAAHHSFLLDLIALHPRVTLKTGCGIRSFRTILSPPHYNGRTFLVVRTDGTEEDFSYIKCVDGDDQWYNFVKAARNSIADQIVAYKQKMFDAGPVECANTGQHLTWENSHVDHAYPATFSAILDEWTKTLDWTAVKLQASPGDWGHTFAEESDAKAFGDFHRERARYRMLTPDENMRLGSRANHRNI